MPLYSMLQKYATWLVVTILFMGLVVGASGYDSTRNDSESNTHWEDQAATAGLPRALEQAAVTPSVTVFAMGAWGSQGVRV